MVQTELYSFLIFMKSKYTMRRVIAFSKAGQSRKWEWLLHMETDSNKLNYLLFLERNILLSKAKNSMNHQSQHCEQLDLGLVRTLGKGLSSKY